MNRQRPRALVLCLVGYGLVNGCLVSCSDAEPSNTVSTPGTGGTSAQPMAMTGGGPSGEVMGSAGAPPAGAPPAAGGATLEMASGNAGSGTGGGSAGGETASGGADGSGGAEAGGATAGGADTGGAGGMAGGAGGMQAPPEPVEEATWSHTDCDQGALDFPDIDRNEGAFPPGSCPPPEDLYRECAAGTKLTIVASDASTFETGYVHPPEYAYDEYMMTRWSSFSNPDEWLSLDFGAEQSFQRVYLAWELAHGSDYDIQVSNDGAAWTTVAEVRDGNGYQDIVDLDGSGRYVRILGIMRGMTDTGGEIYGYSLFDVTICGQRP